MHCNGRRHNPILNLGVMEFNVQLPSDAIERRRLQNRLAQRKFRQKRGQRRGLVTGDDVSADALPNPAVATVGSQTLNPSQSPLLRNPASDGDLTVRAFPSDVDPSLVENSHVAPPDLDDVDLWDFGSADAFLTGTFTELAPPETLLPSPSQLLDELPADRTPSSATRVASSTDDLHVSPTSDSSSGEPPHPAPIRKPLRYRRSAQLKEGLEPARQSEADDEGWLGSLHIAAAKGSERMVEVLLQQQGLDRDERDSDGRTPLMHAVIRGHAAVARILLARGARLGAVDKDARSALHWAVLYRRDDILGILLEKGASNSADGSEDKLDVDAYDDSGCTPLHMAIHQDSEVAVRMLLGAGASLNSKAQKCPFARRLVALAVS